MKTKLPLLLCILLPLTAHAATDLSTALQKGLFEEEANQNLPAAIQAYQALLATSDEQRKLTATALFRLGECYRKLGQTNDAIAQYQRLLRDYADQSPLATLSRQNLRELSVVPARPNIEADDRSSPGISSEARESLRELLEGEIRIAEQLAREQGKRIEAGTLATGEEVRFERDVLGLKRQLVAVDGLSSARDRQEWRDLLSQEIALAEKAVAFERKKLESGKSVASEVARLQRDVLILKRELLTFESTPVRSDAATRQVPSKLSVEAEELARAVELFAQLSGLDERQVRRLLPTLVPDSDFKRIDRLLTEAEEKVLSTTGEEQSEWNRVVGQYKASLMNRFLKIKDILAESIAALDVQVRRQKVEAGRILTGAVPDQADAARKAEAGQAEALLKQLQPMSQQELVRVLPTVAPDALLNSLLEQLSQAERKRAELKPSFSDGHPEVKAVEATLKLLNQQIAERVEGIMKGLAIKAAALKQ